MRKLYDIKNLATGILLVVLLGCTRKEAPTAQYILSTLLSDTTQLVTISHDTLYAQSELRTLYRFSGYAPIWRYHTFDSTRFKNLLEIIENSANHGLEPKDYHLEPIRSQHTHFKPSNNRTQPSDVVNTDLLLSDAFLTIARHYLAGKARPTELNDWECLYEEKNLPQFLWEAVNGDSIKKSLQLLHPPFDQYHLLNKTLEDYQRSKESDRFSQEEVGKIVSSMERWRWLPKSVDSNFITVNIPSYLVRLHAQDSMVLASKAVVGTYENQTPVFNCEITHLVLNPRWNVPSSIFKEEIIPKIQRDTSYLSRNHMCILKTWPNRDTLCVHPDSIDWEMAENIEEFPYRIVQMSGPLNPLGEIKFMFPNQHEVYVHDSPARWLFDREVRMFSHGCIRIEDAKELAVMITGNDSLMYPWFYFGEDEQRSLDQPLPIYINYWTSWVDNEALMFYDDIYGLDSMLLVRMDHSPSLY